MPPGTFGVLEYYDRWVRGGVLSGVPVADGADGGGDDDGPGACDATTNTSSARGAAAAAGRELRAPLSTTAGDGSGRELSQPAGLLG